MLRLGGGTASFRYWRVLVIIIESGMIYSVALICELALYFLGSNAFYIVYDPIAQLTVRSPSPQHRLSSNSAQAITPTMIIILAALQLTSNDVHSRLTRSKNARIFKPGTDGSSTVPLDTMNFAANEALVSAAPKSTMFSGYSSIIPGVNGSDSFASSKPEGQVSFA